jgi:hypothetical protein
MPTREEILSHAPTESVSRSEAVRRLEEAGEIDTSSNDTLDNVILSRIKK